MGLDDFVVDLPSSLQPQIFKKKNRNIADNAETPGSYSK